MGVGVVERTIDVESLLEPISAEEPAGPDLRADTSPLSTFQQIRDKRNKARQLEKQAVYGLLIPGEVREEAAGRGKGPETPDECWRFVREKSLGLLQDASKDVEVAAYLLESAVRLDGFPGLRDGLRLMRGLIEQFWDNVHPRPDEDGVETTILPIARLDSEVLTGVIKRVPVTQGDTVGPFAVWQFRQADELRRCSPEERQTRIDRGAVTKEMLDRASRETSTSFFQETYAETAGCCEELNLLAAALNERCPEVTPTFSTITDTMNEVQAVLRLAAGPRLQADKPSAAKSGEGGSDSAEANLIDNRLMGREDAFRRLDEVAEFFERTEPQSLIPAQLRKVIRWGRMTPAQLYTELIEDSSIREQIFKLLGIAGQRSESESGSNYDSSGYESSDQ